MTGQPIPLARPQIGREEVSAVTAVLQSGDLAQGREVGAFEEEFSNEVVAGRECVAVSSGTAGLHLALLAVGISNGDEVIVPSFTFAATANAVVLAGGVPVFADIEPDYFGLCPDAVAAVVTERTAAIMPVHLYGHPAMMDEISSLARSRGLAIIEDACQAHGAAYDDERVGSLGDAGVFSLYPTKNMTAGEGGVISLKAPADARRVRLLRNQGMERRYENEVVGFNYRMTDIHAAIGRVQLRRLSAWNARRRAIAQFYDAELKGVITPSVSSRVRHVYHQYTIRIASGERDRFASALLEEHGVSSGVYYPTPVHELPAYSRELELPETARAAAEVLSLPIHPGLSERETEAVVAAVNTVAGAGA